MKHFIFLIIVSVFISTGISSCNKNEKSKSGSSDENFSGDASYALGMNIGTSLKEDMLYPDMEELLQGMKDVLYENRTRFSIQRANEIFYDAFSAIRDKQEQENQQAENNFLAENSQNPGINITVSGLQYEVINEGNGPKPNAQDTVRVHYEGSLTNGIVFDSSYSRGEPIEFPLMGVIPGWTEGLQLMSVGSKYRLFIPSNLGYGPQGAGSLIPPHSTLIFEVELLDIIYNN
jgi:FKBP-type peptidyl-prolyl cis-trans isomerase FkpA